MTGHGKSVLKTNISNNEQQQKAITTPMAGWLLPQDIKVLGHSVIELLNT